jgi:DNA-binding LacI/PurR family transcriptional regulator
VEPYNILLNRIKQGEFAVGSRIASERDLAEELQASRAIIRRAISRLAEEGWIESRHGCRPVVRAQPISREQTRTVALLIGSESSYRPFAQILRGCEVELRRHGHLLVFMDTWAETTHESADRGRREQETLDYIAAQAIHGVILWSQEPEFALSRLQSLHGHGIGIVTIDREVPGAILDHVGIDNFRSARLAVDYLIRANHREIAFATEHKDHASTVQQRVEGFLYALRAHGLEDTERAIIRFPFRATADQIAIELQKRREVGNMPTAIFAVNDLYAMRLIRALRSLGLRVPEDVSLIGFDDMEPNGEEEAFLTTIRQPFADIGRIAVRTLLQRFEEPDATTMQVILPTRLIERSSVRVLETVSAVVSNKRHPHTLEMTVRR